MINDQGQQPHRARLRGTGIVWLVAAVPALVLGIVAQLSDHTYERLVGITFLVLAALAGGIGFVLTRYPTREVAVASMAVSGVWVFGAIVGLIPWQFLADKLLFGAFPAVVGISTGLLLLPVVRRGRRPPVTSEGGPATR